MFAVRAGSDHDRSACLAGGADGRGQRRGRAQCSGIVHQPGLFVLPAGRPHSWPIGARSRAFWRCPFRSTIGIISAGRTRWRRPIYTARQKAYASASGKGAGLYAASHRQWPRPMRSAAILTAIEQAERATAKRSGVLSVPLAVVERGDKIDVSVGAAAPASPQAGRRLSSRLRQFPHRHRTARRKRRFDADLRQCRARDDQNRRLERRAGQSAGRSFAGASQWRRFLRRDRPGAASSARPSTILAAARGP